MLRSVRRLLARALADDPSLVTLPKGVKTCRVFRNVMSMEEEDLVYEEYGRVIDREGQEQLLDGTNKEDRIVKLTYLEIHGLQDFTEVKSWNRKEIKHLPGLSWSPTLMKILRELSPRVLNFEPDTGRIVEHTMPGYEMHVENPTVGSSFIYVNLLCDTVLEFDDEPTHRSGQVYLPARSIMYVADEARWGFRFGERSEDTHVFRMANGATRRVEMDMRVGIQLWKFNTSLIDGRVLQDRLEEGLVQIEKKLAAEEQRKRLQTEKDEDECEAIGALEAPGSNRFNIQPEAAKLSPMESIQALVSSGAAGGAASGGGSLGGDLNDPAAAAKDGDTDQVRNLKQKEAMKEMSENYARHKDEFSHVHDVLQEMKVLSDAGQPINDMWLKKKVTENPQNDPERDAADGFDPENVEETWDRADAKARFYKAKLKTMDYDGTAFLNPTTPDVTKDAPLDMRATIRKIAPLVKDGDKILQSLPGGQGR